MWKVKRLLVRSKRLLIGKVYVWGLIIPCLLLKHRCKALQHEAVSTGDGEAAQCLQRP